MIEDILIEKINNKEFIEWLGIIESYSLSENFLIKYGNKIDCYYSECSKHSRSDIVRSNFFYLSKYQVLSENFIEKNEHNVDWDLISVYQRLSEEFIYKYRRKLNWEYISRYQNLQPIFISKHYSKYPQKMGKEGLINNYDIDENIIIFLKGSLYSSFRKINYDKNLNIKNLIKYNVNQIKSEITLEDSGETSWFKKIIKKMVNNNAI